MDDEEFGMQISINGEPPPDKSEAQQAIDLRIALTILRRTFPDYSWAGEVEE